jgi:hypothetical protein
LHVPFAAGWVLLLNNERPDPLEMGSGRSAFLVGGLSLSGNN